MASDQGDSSSGLSAEARKGDSSSGLSAEARRKLERTAFARPESKRQADAAAGALRRLVDADEAERLANPPQHRGAPPDALLGPAASVPPSEDESVPGEEPPLAARWRRRPVPLVIALGLVVGLGIGFIAVRASPLFSAGSKPTGSSTNDASGDFGSFVLSPAKGDVTGAYDAIDAPRTAADLFPVPKLVAILGLSPSSIHRVMTAQDGLTLWIARTTEDICLIYTGPTANDGTGANCATPMAFGTSGLTLTGGNDKWAWNGDSFTISVPD